MNLLHRDKNHYSRTVAILFTHLFTYLKILKMGPTVLFTYLKIILLQCTTKQRVFRLRFFGPRFKKRGPKLHKAPFFKNGA